MVAINVKTRGNSSSQGKAKVYFSSHPKDNERYLNMLCEDIFETQNCAIYYMEHELTKDDQEEWTSIVGDMQLFVVPVTTSYLFDDASARCFEYGFAMEQHIPVLPIVVEAGCEASFPERMNQIKAGYGETQYLSRVSSDVTEIAYNEKLEKRLNDILVKEDLAKRVREAFDAYIFLSYRKKDRAYAKELMKMIHRIPFCRDIAIWYDEYLIPGEKWTEAIMEALDKSSVVAMAVTPSLLEPNNYIIDHEYPDALEKGKKVIPVELTHTDRKALSRLFKGLDKPIKGNDEKALKKALRSIAIKENDQQPEHLFLIGLAYLGAIDVERDVEKAVELITTAANHEHLEAISKLVSMYQNGEGVHRDYQKAIDWQKKLITLLENNNNQQIFSWKMHTALLDLTHMQIDLAQYDEAETTNQQHEAYFDALQHTCNSIARKEALILIKQTHSAIAKGKGNVRGAYRYYNESLPVVKELAEELQTDLSRYNLFSTYSAMGDAAKSANAFEIAETCYKEAYDIAKTIKEPIRSKDALAKSSISLGLLNNENGQLTKAINYLQTALKIREEQAEEFKTVQAKQNLADILRMLSELYQSSGDLTLAKECIQKSFTLQKELTETTMTIESRRLLASNYVNLATLSIKERKASLAKSYFFEALKINEALLEQVDTVAISRSMITIYGGLGNISFREKDYTKTKEYGEKTLSLTNKLFGKSNDPDIYRTLLISYNLIGDACRELGDMKAAKDYYRKGLNVAKDILSHTKSIQAYDDIGVFLYRLGNLGEGDRYFLERAHKVYCQLEKDCPGVKAYTLRRQRIEQVIKEKFN